MSTTASETKTNKSRWFPLESNPALLNKYISNMGFDISSHKFYDVYSTEEWALGMVPQPAAAVIMLYPLTKTQVDYQKEEGKLGKEETVVKGNEGEKATSSSVTNQSSSASSTPSVWHMKQRIGNACGTVGGTYLILFLSLIELICISLLRLATINSFMLQSSTHWEISQNTFLNRPLRPILG